MESKHLKSGDALPQLKEGTLRIYSMKFCPYAHRTRLVLHHKNIPHEEINVNLKEKPSWFLERNPVGTVPTLELDGGKVLWESAVCDDYLDEKYPDNPLNPKDPFEKARQRIIMERWPKVITQFYIYVRNPEEAPTVKKELSQLLQVFEKEVKNKQYFGGAQVSMCDYHIWAHFERLYSLTKLENSKDILGDFPKDFPGLSSWVGEMMKLPNVRTLYTEPHVLEKFLKINREQKTYDYDAI